MRHGNYDRNPVCCRTSERYLFYFLKWCGFWCLLLHRSYWSLVSHPWRSGQSGRLFMRLTSLSLQNWITSRPTLRNCEFIMLWPIGSFFSLPSLPTAFSTVASNLFFILPPPSLNKPRIALLYLLVSNTLNMKILPFLPSSLPYCLLSSSHLLLPLSDACVVHWASTTSPRRRRLVWKLLTLSACMIASTTRSPPQTTLSSERLVNPFTNLGPQNLATLQEVLVFSPFQEVSSLLQRFGESLQH